MSVLRGWEPPDRGVLFVVSGPSGVGKSTLVKAALARIPGLSFSVSATTRAPRPGERDGVEYHFLSPDQFAERVATDGFLEHATVYGNRYGTLRAPTEAALSRGQSLLLDIDVQGSARVRAALEGSPETEAAHVFILPPTFAALEARLRGRGTEGEDAIARRMSDAAEQLRGAPTYDYLVVNDDLETAHAALQGVLLAEMSRRARRSSALARVLDALPAV